MADIKLIKASAGSGKTHRLMELFSECVKNGTSSPEKLLATTFTVKAAANLKSEIRRKLIETGHPDLAAKVFNGLIGTVNGVCGQLLAEYAIDAGFSPEMAVLPEENADGIFKAATDAVIQSHSRELESLASRLELNPARQPMFGHQEDWREDIREIVQKARANGIAASRLDEMAESSCNSIEKIFSGKSNVTLEDIKLLIKPYAEQDYGKLAKDVQKFHDDLGSFCKYPTWGKIIALTNAACPSSKKYPGLAEIHSALGGMAVLDSRSLHDDLCKMIRRVFACARESMEAYADYKRKMGLIDFTDQECEVLKLLEGNESFREQLRNRLDSMMVDEFQDTSPIQLAVFLKLNELCRNGSVWVGDPKQAIYGFRGTDPELMATCVRELRSAETLEYSWRSKENLVRLSNEIFTRVFRNTPAEEIRLGIPDERKDEAKDGTIEAWHMPVEGRQQSNYPALARGISNLLDSGIKAKDIAVLMRTNPHKDRLAEELAKWNIATTSESGKLRTSPECILAMAGFRYCLDKEDTVAMATLLAMAGDVPDWPKKLLEARTASKDCRDFLDGIRQLPFLKKLATLEDETPLELLERVITTMDLEQKARTMPFPEKRLANLDALRALCKSYMDTAETSHSTATSTGFLSEMQNTDVPAASGIGENCINLLTYHAAKGLEWPVVILGDLNEEPKTSVFGPVVISADIFRMEAPLAGRTLRYWPYPFGAREARNLKERLDGMEEYQSAYQNAVEETKRLFYVGLTRARDRVIFAMTKKAPTQDDLGKNPHAVDRLQTAWLDALADEQLLNFPSKEGMADWKVGDDAFPLTTRHLAPSAQPIPRSSLPALEDTLKDTLCRKEDTSYSPARGIPSGLHADDGKATLLCNLPKLTHSVGNPPDYGQLGNVFHNYFALNPQQDRIPIAERLISNWQMQKYVKAETVVEASEHLYAWLRRQYPDGTVTTEVPVTCHDDNGTLYQGFIDMLVETADGYVIIDHKAGGAADAAAFAAGHIAQLRLYKEAVETATRKNVLELVIHLPVMEKCYKIE